MKLKLDENLGERGRSQLQHAGHDVATVPEQALTSATDADLIRICMEEGPALVTLDLDFANPLRFRPSQYAGIAVLRLPDKPSAADLESVVRSLAAGLAGAQAQPSLPLGELRGHLWIVERGHPGLASAEQVRRLLLGPFVNPLTPGCAFGSRWAYVGLELPRLCASPAR